MIKDIIYILKVIRMRYRCAHSIRYVKTTIQDHVMEIEGMSKYFKKVSKSYKNIIIALEYAADTLEKAEKELTVIYHREWNSTIKQRLSDQIIMIQENKQYLLGLKQEMDLVAQTAQASAKS